MKQMTHQEYMRALRDGTAGPAHEKVEKKAKPKRKKKDDGE